MTQVFSGPITGRKFFVIFALFFIVIISVNVVLAVSAVRTFPGLEVKNSYVASQRFDADRAAQEALNWNIDARVQKGTLHLTITDTYGVPVEVTSLNGIFGRATSVQDDQIPAFEFDGQSYVAPVTTAPGNWNLRFEATALDGTNFRQRVIVIVES